MYHQNEEINDALKELLDEDLISMSWCDEKEEMIFFMTERQKEVYDITHGQS